MLHYIYIVPVCEVCIDLLKLIFMDTIELDPFKANPIGKLKDSLVILKEITFEQSKDLAFVNLCFVEGDIAKPMPFQVSFGRDGDEILYKLINNLQYEIDLSKYKSCYLTQGSMIGQGIDSSEKRAILSFVEVL